MLGHRHHVPPQVPQSLCIIATDHCIIATEHCSMIHLLRISELRVVAAFCKQVVPATKSARHEMSPTDKMKRSLVTGMAKYHSVAHGRRHLKTQLESRRIRPVHTLHTCIMVRLQRMHLLRSFHECNQGLALGDDPEHVVQHPFP